MFNLIFTLALALLALLFVVVGLLKGKKYVWHYSVGRIVALVLSAAGAFFLAIFLSGFLTKIGYNALLDSGILGEVGGMLSDIPSAPQAVSAIVSMIAAPIFFVILFLILKPILNIFPKMISKAMVRASGTEKNTSEKAKKVIREKGLNPLGMVSGACFGALLFLILMIPFVGTMGVADGVMGVVAGATDLTIVDTVDEVVDAAANNGVSQAVNLLGGKKVYGGLTTYDVGTHRVSLQDEMNLVSSVGNAIALSLDETASREDAANEIRKISAAFNESDLIPTLVPEFLTAANESWKAGEDFHGIEKISLSGDLEEVTDPLVEILASSDYDTIKADVNTVVRVVAVMVEEDVISSIEENPLDFLKREDVLSQILYELLDNESLSPMVGTVTEFGVHKIGHEMHFHEHREALYAEFTTEAANRVSMALMARTDDQLTMMSDVYVNLFDDFGMNISKESSVALAESTLNTYANREISVEEMKTLLAAEPLTLKDGTTVQLDSADAVAENSLLVCIDEIVFDTSRIVDKEAESKALARVVGEALTLVDLIQGEGIANAASIQKLGPILDALAHTETIGYEDTGRLLTGMLQSDMVHDQIGFSLVGATEVALSINRNSTTKGYVPLLKSLSDTIEVVQMTVSTETKKEEVKEKVDVLLEDLTPESADVLQTLSKPDVMISQGVPEQSAEPVSNMMSNMFGNLSSAKENGMTDEEYQREAEATTNLLNMAMNSSNKEEGFFSEDPEDENAMTASDYIDSVMNSTVISQTVVETAYGENEEVQLDPLNTKAQLTESEQEQVISALNNHWTNATEEEKADTEYQKTYLAIAALVNLQIGFTADGVVTVPTVPAQ